MDAMLIFRDWFHEPTLMSEPQLASALKHLMTRIADRFPSFVSYDFLPLGFINASEDELQALVAEANPLIQYAIGVSNGWRRYPGLYKTVLNSLNALRSQTGYQVYQWIPSISLGGKLPNNDFVGGWWPPQKGYPHLDFKSGQIEADDTLILGASPAWMPVMNMSIKPANIVYEPTDPVLLALILIAQTHLIVVAAGNDGPAVGTLNPWCLTESVLSVGATDDKEGARLADSSSRGFPDGHKPGPDLVAWGAGPSGDFGTSYAAPRVAMMGVFCAALCAQVQHAGALAHDIRDSGVPLMGWGLIDSSDQTLALPGRLDVPALPILGVRWEVMSEALGEVDFRIAIDPSLLKKIILEAARPMPGYHAYEVGAGFISETLLLEHLATITVGEVVRWFDPDVHLRKRLARELAFNQGELEALAQVVQRTAPTWFWDIDLEKFIVNGSRQITWTAAEADSIIKSHAYKVASAGLL